MQPSCVLVTVFVTLYDWMRHLYFHRVGQLATRRGGGSFGCLNEVESFLTDVVWMIHCTTEGREHSAAQLQGCFICFLTPQTPRVTYPRPLEEVPLSCRDALLPSDLTCTLDILFNLQIVLWSEALSVLVCSLSWLPGDLFCLPRSTFQASKDTTSATLGGF